MKEKIPHAEHPRYPTDVEVLYGFDKIIHGAHITSIDKNADDDGVISWNIEATLPDGRKIECAYKRAQHLAGTDLPSRIHSVIYGSSTEGSERGPEYHYDTEKLDWIEQTLPTDKRG